VFRIDISRRDEYFTIGLKDIGTAWLKKAMEAEEWLFRHGEMIANTHPGAVTHCFSLKYLCPDITTFFTDNSFALCCNSFQNKKILRMKIALIGASGKIGSRISEEALSRGHSVTGIVRHPDSGIKNERIKWVTADALNTELLASLFRGHDAVISAFGIDWQNPGTYPMFSEIARSLIDATKKSGVRRLINVGGAGSLEVAPGLQLVDTPAFPEGWKKGADEQRKSLEVFRKEQDLEWTFFCPAIMIEPGSRTGIFRIGKDSPVFDENGNSTISYDDYAAALINELEHPNFIRQRFTIGY
jgi:putative NADH-flavin reductase